MPRLLALRILDVPEMTARFQIARAPDFQGASIFCQRRSAYGEPHVRAAKEFLQDLACLLRDVPVMENGGDSQGPGFRFHCSPNSRLR
jgi:hypothetical protein